MKTPPSSGRTETVNGMRMYYEIHGQGEPVLLLHGLSGAGGYWEPFITRLPAEYQLVIPDMRGHGRSTNPSLEFTHRQSALDVFGLLDLLGVERFKAIGVSCGGNTLLHMATQQPCRVEAMGLVSATAYFPHQAMAIMRQFTVDNMAAKEWHLMRQRHKYGDEQIRDLWAQGNGFK